MFDKKTHYKMYKSGKNWMFGAITTATFLFGLSSATTTSHADQVKANASSVSTESSINQVVVSSQQSQVVLRSAKAAQSSAKTTASLTVSSSAASSVASSISSKAESSAETAVHSARAVNFAVKNPVKASTASSQSTATQKQSSTTSKSQNAETSSTSKMENPTQSPNLKLQVSQTTKSSVKSSTQVTKQTSAAQVKNNDVKAAPAKTTKPAATTQTSSSKKEEAHSFAASHPDVVQVKENGHWYLREDGKNLTGFQKIENDKEHKIVYYNNQGQMQYGQQKINNNWYLFDNTTGAMKFGYQWLDKERKEVYYDPNKGNMVYGQQKINGHWQYFNRVTGAQAKSQYIWIANQNKEVYYDCLGNMVYGQQKINGKWQYFDNVTGAQAKNKFVNIKDQHKTVFYDKNGNMLYGQQKLNGKWYLFDKTTGAMKTGFQYLGSYGQNKTVYYNNQGQMQYGNQQINGKWYKFDTVTGAMYCGITIDHAKNVLRYYNDGGELVTGYYNDGGQTYHFVTQDEANKSNGKLTVGQLMENGLIKFKGKTYMLNQNHVVSGQQKLNGKWYLFSNQTGEMLTGFQNLKSYGQNKICYYNPANGQMMYGQQKINNNWYLFDKTTGARLTGFHYLGAYGQNKECYYNQDGTMHKGWLVTDRYTYYFDTTTGAQIKNASKNINGRWYKFDRDGHCLDFNQRVVNWFESRKGKLTYSMSGSRNGADGTADCSGSMTQAIRDAGAGAYSYLYNTETLHDYLRANGYYLVTANGSFTPKRGDVIIWGKRGQSAGAGGHTVVISQGGKDAQCISTCYYTNGQRGTAVQELPYWWYWKLNGSPYYYVYRQRDEFRN